MVRTVLVSVAAFSAVVCCAVAAHAQDTSCLRIGSTFSGIHSVDSRVEKNMRAVLATLDLCIQVVSGPARRLTEELIRGNLDGELFRVREYAAAVDGAAVLVDEPLADVVGYLVAAAGIDLDTTPTTALKVGVLRGVKWHRTASATAAEVITANDMEQLLFMLRNRRVDGILIGGFLRQEYPELANLPAKIAYKSTAHFVLHLSQAKLALPIGAAIRAFTHRGCSFILVDGGSACSESGILEESLRYGNDTGLPS